MWESPITMITENIASGIISKTDEVLVEYVYNVGFDVDKEELVKALAYDRGQYEKGYADGRADRDAEVVRCKDCKYFDQAEKYCCNFLTTEEDGFCKWGEKKE